MTDQKSKKNNTSWKPGQSGNPQGRSGLPDHLVKAKKLSKIKVAELIYECMELTVEQLNERMKKDDVKYLEHLILKIMLEAAKSGDYQRVNFLMDRTIGKVQEKIKHEGLPNPVVIHRRSGDKVEMGYPEDKDDE